MTATFTSTARTSDPVEELRIEIGALEEAAYDLVIRVRDLLDGGEATASTPFSLVKP